MQWRNSNGTGWRSVKKACRNKLSDRALVMADSKSKKRKARNCLYWLKAWLG